MPRCPPEDERGAEEPPLVESRGARLGPPRQGGPCSSPRGPRAALARSSTRMFPPGPETPETPSPPQRGRGSDRSPDLAAGARAFASGPRAGPPGLLTHDGPWREQRTQRLPALRTLPT